MLTLIPCTYRPAKTRTSTRLIKRDSLCQTVILCCLVGMTVVVVVVVRTGGGGAYREEVVSLYTVCT